MLQTAEGALDEITNNMQRIRTLALQSANGTNSEQDRKALQQEVAELSAEINRIVKDTTYAGRQLLSGEQTHYLVPGNFKGATKDQNLVEVRTVTHAPGGHDPITQKDPSIKDYAKVSFQVGADANQTIETVLGLEQKITLYHYDFNDNYMCTNPTIDGVSGDRNLVVGFDLNSLYTAFTSNIPTSEYVCVTKDAPESYHKTGFEVGDDGNVSFDVSTAESSQQVLKIMEKFISAVDSKRAEFGAVQNRLESTIRNQSNVLENVSDARSRIRDADFAVETAKLTQENISQQAAQSVLSQANMTPNIALKLLEQ